MLSSLNFGQINLQHAGLARDELNHRSYDIDLVTEPYIRHGQLQGFHIVGSRVFAVEPSPRALIRIRHPKVTALQINNYCTKDIVTVGIQYREGKWVYLCSAYLDINDNEVIPQTLRDITHYCKREGIPLLIAADSNAHSYLWGDSENERGTLLAEFLEEAELMVCNRGIAPTYSRCNASSVIDITVINQHFFSELEVLNWRVEQEASFSDHKYILFGVQMYMSPLTAGYNFRKGNWDLFRVNSTLPVINHTMTSIDECTDALTLALREAIACVCPAGKRCSRRPQPWWTPALAAERIQLREVTRRYMRHPTEERHTDLTKTRRTYQRNVRAAKRQSWRHFLTEAEGPQMLSKIVKRLGGITQKEIGTVCKTDGTYTSTPEDTLIELLTSSFPDFQEVTLKEQVIQNSEDVDDKVVAYITSEKVTSAFDSFKSFKASGPDDIPPIALKHLSTELLQYITQLYKAILTTGYTPRSWRKVRVVYIPKPGKDRYDTPKAFRPISLTSFLGKGLERIIQWYINEHIIPEPLPNQHAYTRGMGTETALTEVVNFAEKMILRGQNCLLVSFDCTGAFDYIKHEKAREVMTDLGYSQTIINWYEFYLQHREVSATLSGVTKTIRPMRGSPQGGVLSPVVWTMIMNPLLAQFTQGPIKAVGYADDILLCIGGTDPDTMGKIMQKAINRVLLWGQDNGLTFNPSKTQIMMVTKRHRCSKPILKMGTQVLKYSSEIKYLGIVFNDHLTWHNHIKAKVRKANKILQMVRTLVGHQWGLDPEKVHWIYQAIVKPTITYGCLVWAHTLTKDQCQALQSIQRRVLLAITHAMRSTPTKGMEAILGLPPLDLFIQEEATKAICRLRENLRDSWDGLTQLKLRPYGHRRWHKNILTKLGLWEANIDKIKATRVWDWQGETSAEDVEADYHVYTDGSKQDDGSTGAGWILTKGNHVLEESSIPLSETATVFQAEVMAIAHALSSIQDLGKYQGHFIVYTDSQAALGALSGTVKSRLVLDCVNTLHQFRHKNTLQLQWVKGHANNTGNEVADCKAKLACEMPNKVSIPLAVAECKERIREYYHKVWQQRWTESNDCRQTKEMFPVIKHRITKMIRSYSKAELARLIQMGTGHCLLAYHLSQWQKGVEPTCKLCHESLESPIHLLNECEPLWRTRQEFEFNVQHKTFERALLLFFDNENIRALEEINQ